MPKTRTITVSIPAAIAERLDRLASLTERDISGLATDALEIYTRYELEIVEGILEGMADARAGRVHTSEEMRADLERIIAEAQAERDTKRRQAVGE
ncbi:CopG family ribbon-helix-helix protein [Devosia sp.]|uniref:CopG family ribbon-helix-helix protein n=1 Tax=Devosia sp. TaxID=1871048 RepID=UPI0035AD7E2C